jgi:hypothetical protein
MNLIVFYRSQFLHVTEFNDWPIIPCSTVNRPREALQFFVTTIYTPATTPTSGKYVKPFPVEILCDTLRLEGCHQMVEERTVTDPAGLHGEIAFHDTRIAAFEGELIRIGKALESTGRSIQGFQLGIDWGALQDVVARAQSLISLLTDEVLLRDKKINQLTSGE